MAGVRPVSAADCGDTVTLRSEPSACPLGWGLVPSHRVRLPQKSIMAKFDSWPTAATGTVPSLSGVLKAVNAPTGAKRKVVALDGYAAEFEAKDNAAHNWILAMEADSKPLGIGERGPATARHHSTCCFAIASAQKLPDAGLFKMKLGLRRPCQHRGFLPLRSSRSRETTLSQSVSW